MGAARKGWGLSAALVAAVVVLGLQSIRVLIPMLYEVRERSSAIDAVALAAVVFLAPLLAPVLRRILGAMAVLVAIASAALSRVGMQLWHPIPLWLASLAVAGGLLAWTFLLGARETRHGGVFVCGLLIGLSVDAAIHAAFGTWDPAWQTGAWPLVLASAIAAAAIVLGGTAPPSVERTASRGALPAAAVGPFVLLELLFLQNVAGVGSSAGLSLPAASLVVLLGLVLGLGTVLSLWGVRVPVGARIVAAAVLMAVAYFLPGAEGWAAVGGVLVAQALASAALGTTLGRGLDPLAVESAGTWRTAVAVALGGASFVVLAFLYQISFDDSLPFPRAVVPAVAAGLLALGAVRRDQVGDGERPGMRALIVPLAALALVPVGLVLGQPNPEPAAGSGHSFRLLDYNIHSAVDEHGQLDLQGLARTISAQHPDVVVLQEVARGWIIAGTADEAEWLSVRLGMPYAWAPAADEEFGNLVLSRLPLLHAEAVPLPYGVGPQHRSYLRVALDAGKGRTLTLIATHLQDAPETSTRRNQILALLGAEGSSAPTLIVGDMNSQPTEPGIRLFTSSGLLSAQDVTGHGAESTATNPRFSGDRVDWIFGTRDLTFYAFRVVRATISDHLPLAVSVRLPTG